MRSQIYCRLTLPPITIVVQSLHCNREVGPHCKQYGQLDHFGDAQMLLQACDGGKRHAILMQAVAAVSISNKIS